MRNFNETIDNAKMEHSITGMEVFRNAIIICIIGSSIALIVFIVELQWRKSKIQHEDNVD